MNLRNLFKKSSQSSSPYEALTGTQKLAAMKLMVVFGGACPGTSQILNKINHIMTVEGGEMGVSGDQVRAASFTDMKDMVEKLKDANRVALEKLLWPFYSIVCLSNSLQAVQVLINVYAELGFSAQECANILEKKAGRKVIGIQN